MNEPKSIVAPEPVDDLFAPPVWVVVVGYNNADDTIECIQSVRRSSYPRMTVLYVDNGSRPEEDQKVRNAIPSLRAIRHPENLGVARGFNSGISYALKQGAEFVVMANNDTTFDEEAVSEMVKCVKANPKVAIVIPKIFYHNEPRVIWAAGSRFRRFPPAIIQNRTTDDDDGRFDRMKELAFAPYCITLFTRDVLLKLGLLDTNYHFFYEDYDFCLLARDRGFRVGFAPESHAWHKISKTIKSGGKGNAKFYRIYGRSHAIFSRKFKGHREMTGLLSRCYLYARTLYEGGLTGFRAFHEGMQQGAREELLPVPRWDVAEEAHMIDYSRQGGSDGSA